MANIRKILVVDDEDAIRTVLSAELEYEGYDVDTAADGVEALSKIEKVHYDLVLLDIKMPRMNGFEVLLRTKVRIPNTKVIMLTGFADLKNAVESKKLGAEEFVSKPCDLVDLFIEINRVMDKGELSLREEAERLSSLASTLVNNITKGSYRRIWQLYKTWKGRVAFRGEGGYAAICGAVAHGLKGEFLHIANSARTVRELAGTSEKINEECDIIDRSVEYSQLQLRRLLDFVNLGIPQPVPVDVSELLLKTEQHIAPRLPSTIRLKIFLSDEAKGRMIGGSYEQLQGVLVEFIDNARVALSWKGGGNIAVAANIAEGAVIISVADDGPGIPHKLRKKLLRSQVPSRSGLGLGLFLSDKVIKQLGGEMSFQSSDKGTTFTMRLPITGKVD